MKPEIPKWIGVRARSLMPGQILEDGSEVIKVTIGEKVIVTLRSQDVSEIDVPFLTSDTVAMQSTCARPEQAQFAHSAAQHALERAQVKVKKARCALAQEQAHEDDIYRELAQIAQLIDTMKETKEILE